MCHRLIISMATRSKDLVVELACGQVAYMDVYRCWAMSSNIAGCCLHVGLRFVMVMSWWFAEESLSNLQPVIQGVQRQVGRGVLVVLLLK